uniref:EF-hand domain-containing protein n=1 Tax=Eutreptiella gymnastica TaxID=73025 RepID=A0A6T2CJ65_9EUGL|mmetsp:Transcript_42101/g.68612  ORF Transcript_42101/g.68612 Transcript_42101/m.68612 type:complete len:437 (-) Transcript_42101:1496-2806(-)
MSSNSLLDVQEMQWTLSQDPQELHNDAEAEILPMQKLLVRSISNLSIDRMRRSSRRGSIQSDCSDESLGLSGHSTSPYFGQSLSPCEDVSRSISGCADYSDANTLAPSAYVRRSPNECIRRSPRDYLRPSDFQQPQAEVQQDVQSIPGQEDRPLRNDSQLEEDSTSQNSMLLSIRNISIHRISRESSLQSDYSEPPSGRPRDGIRRVPSDAIPRRRSTCSGYLDNEYSGPSGCMRRRSSMQSESDLQVWWKLFCFLDDDGSSSITQDAVHQKLSQMVGECEWADENGNDAMEFDEFVQCMTDLPLSKKHACLAWAREYCEDQTRGQPVPPIGPQYEAPHWAADKSLMAPHVFDKQVSEEDLAAWKRLYDFVDEDKNGLITQREITDKMSHMVGPFDWEDVNADGAMDFHEFVSCMLALPKSKRFTCLLWAMHECPN